MIRIKLNRAILMPRFSHFLVNRTINFRMFECLVTCFLRVTVSLLCRFQAVSKIHVPIYLCLIISEGRRNRHTATKPFDRHSKETATVRKDVTKYNSENLRIVAVELLWLTQFASPNPLIYFNFAWCLGSVAMNTSLN